MQIFYEIKEGSLVESGPENATLVVHTVSNDEEKQKLLQDLPMDAHDLESALDPDEISRVELESEYTYIIWKQPNNVSFSQQLKFEVSSVGLFLHRGRLNFIALQNQFSFVGREFQKISSLNDLMLRFFLQTIRHYLGHLKVIRQMNMELQGKLVTSMENRYLLQMFALEESLTYYLNAIEGNMSVLTKMRANAAKMGLSELDLEKLDDVIIEHQQCLRQTQIYSSVLAGLMDARGNIINNNMNVLLKNLTLINVVFLPLNLIASVGGMSEFSMMTHGVNWTVSYSIFMLALIVLGWLTWLLLTRKIMDNGRQKPRKKAP